MRGWAYEEISKLNLFYKNQPPVELFATTCVQEALVFSLSKQKPTKNYRVEPARENRI
jgi:hypothetical protein